MKAKLLSQHGSSSLILYTDSDGVFQACIVDSEDVMTSRVGEEFTLEDTVLSRATPYGIDWSVPYPGGICISAGDFQNVMYRHGVISLEDLKRNTNAVVDALVELWKISTIEIYKAAKSSMEV
jgi:hypothetical protein